MTPDDVKSIARPVLAHRLVLTAEAALARRTADDVVGDVLEETPAPAIRYAAIASGLSAR